MTTGTSDGVAMHHCTATPWALAAAAIPCCHWVAAVVVETNSRTQFEFWFIKSGSKETMPAPTPRPNMSS